MALSPPYFHIKEMLQADSIKVLGLTVSNNLKWEVTANRKHYKAKRLANALQYPTLLTLYMYVKLKTI